MGFRAEEKSMKRKAAMSSVMWKSSASIFSCWSHLFCGSVLMSSLVQPLKSTLSGDIHGHSCGLDLDSNQPMPDYAFWCDQVLMGRIWLSFVFVPQKVPLSSRAELLMDFNILANQTFRHFPVSFPASPIKTSSSIWTLNVTKSCSGTRKRSRPSLSLSGSISLP